MAIPSEFSVQLRIEGWASLALGRIPDLPEHVTSIARTLGTIVASPGRKKIETISPQSEGSAPVSSLSHAYGLGALPLHTDTAHWTVPCRYIILACVEVGSVRTPTLLVDSRDASFSKDECLLLRSSIFLIKNGGRSFYTSLIDSRRDFIRIDPGCMEPISESSVTAMRLYDIERQRRRFITWDWHEGDVLVIDNWRVLHGRGNNVPSDQRRKLLRVYAQ